MTTDIKALRLLLAEINPEYWKKAGYEEIPARLIAIETLHKLKEDAVNALPALLDELERLEAEANRECHQWVVSRKPCKYGLYYSMTTCALSGTIGQDLSEFPDGRRFCPNCGGKVRVSEGEVGE